MPYTICVYSKIWDDLEQEGIERDNDKPDHVFHAKTKRSVVGLMKTIMDNFKPVHVDIIDDEAFYGKRHNKEVRRCK